MSLGNHTSFFFDRNLKTSPQKSTADVINQTLGQIKKLANDATATAREELDSWIENTQTLKYEFDDSHGKRVTDAYFAGGEPFSRPKHRMDFPDAFIYESVKDIAAKRGTLHVIVADGNLKDACERLGNVRTYDSIEEFIRLPEGDVLRFLSKKNDVWFPKLKPVPVMGTEKENHTSWERYYRVSDCSSSSRNDWYLGR